VVVAFVALACWVGWLAWHVNRDLSAAVDDASRLQTSVNAGDDPATRAALADLQRHSSDASDRTDGLTWSALSKVPLVGDDAEGVRVVSDVVADLSRDGIAPLARIATDLESLLPRDGAISIDAVRDLQDPVSTGDAAFAEAAERLSSQDTSGFIDRLRVKYRDLAARVSDAAAVLHTADTTLQVLPSMLGGDEKRTYLVVFQNNAEIRATGGLPGAVSLVTAQDGKVKMTRQVAASSLGETDRPVLPLSKAEQAIYGPQLGTYFLDANFTPDFPRTADLMRTRWEQLYPDKIDGVLSIDPVALSYILEATGPIAIGDLSLTSDNAVDELVHQVYLRYADPATQDAWFRLVARAVFDKVTDGSGSPQQLIRGLVQGADEGRIYVHSFEADETKVLGGTQIAGELVTDPGAPPQVGVYLNDATGGKMSYYLRYSVTVDSTYCSEGIQRLAAHARLLSDAPDDAAKLPDYITGAGRYGTDPGSQLVLVRLYGPVGGEMSNVELNAEPVRDLEFIDQDGRPVATITVFLTPRNTVDLTWRMKTGAEQTGETRLTVTPSTASRAGSTVVPTTCAA
jgi:hypothetical protein